MTVVKGSMNVTQKRQNAESLLVKDIRLGFHIQEKSAQLKMFN